MRWIFLGGADVHSSLLMTFGLFGGLGLFLYGMQLMADGLQKMAGDRLRKLIEVLTSTPLIGVLIGTIVTMLIQSSSATSVMVVGFVNAGLMTLRQAISVILGAAIGTTVTAFMVSLKLSDLALPAIAIGFLLSLVGKSRRVRFGGQALLGFGLLFLGLTIMGDAMKPLGSNPVFTDMILNFSQRPILGVLAGVLFTAVVQSSSATSSLVVAMASEGLLDLNASFSIILGANIGTTVTALLASIPMHLAAKRAALANVVFKTIGVLIFLVLFHPFTTFIAKTFSLVHRQAANANIIFNVINALLMLPFIPALERLLERLLPGTDPIEQVGSIYLDTNLLNTPSVALGQAARELVRMGKLAIEMLDKSLTAFNSSDHNHLVGVEQIEETIDQLERDIVDYLVRLSQKSLSTEQSERLNALLHVSSDLERIGDHAQNIADLADYRIEHRLPFSEEAEAELADISSRVRNLVEAAVALLTSNDKTSARHIITAEGDIDLLEKSLRRQHIKRLNNGVCFPASGIIYLDLISNLERVADHANNIAEALTDVSEDKTSSTNKVSYSASN